MCVCVKSNTPKERKKLLYCEYHLLKALILQWDEMTEADNKYTEIDRNLAPSGSAPLVYVVLLASSMDWLMK